MGVIGIVEIKGWRRETTVWPVCQQCGPEVQTYEWSALMLV